MAEETSVEAVAASATSSPAGKKAKAAKSGAAKKPRVKPTHPKTSEMVTNAIKNLKERGGSSLQAIKKYVAANYKVDAEKLAPFIRRYLKSAVTSGALVQTKGKGASGSFKLAGAPSKSEKPVAKKPRGPSKKTSAGEKKVKKSPASPKKKPTAAAKKAVAAKKPSGEKKAAKKVASPAKKKVAPKQKPTKASAKSAGTKPKVPKPKKTGSPKKAAAPKKTAAKKK
ncbi:histone H1-like [Phlebotomus argentipes]|uniref:histone H1-like n=1 Tax=Phlebotomus argentipes TaxID=94469 RepID=UPI0028937B8B|nr:histone H1-like [Phlebotomus argentipes]